MVSGSAPHILPSGDRALLAEYADGQTVLDAFAALAADPLPGVIDLVPAARTILATFDPSLTSLPQVRSWLASPPSASGPRAGGDVVNLRVRYDGADLVALAAQLDLSPEALVARHCAARWTVAFTGFAPGFGYLVCEDWPFDVPRLPTPRTSVPAGSVGLAADFCGVYPRATPGGWQLIGTTDTVLFDVDREPPALLHPGAGVRFTAAS